MKKTGVNEPCPCGSGKKFKKCCQLIPYFKRLQGEAIAEFDRKKIERAPRFGDVRPFVHTFHQGKMVIAEHNKVYLLDGCKTVPDFLDRYIKLNFGKDWWLKEVGKNASDMHPVPQLSYHIHKKLNDAPPNSDGLVTISPSGLEIDYLTLGYDLFTLKDNAAFQKRLLKRMMSSDQYPGARHELFVAATFVRAGFEICYEDESDGNSKHPEFIAIHKKTGQRIAVEAKRKHWERSIKGSTPETIRSSMRRLLVSALKKAPCEPFAVFLDLNISPVQENPFEQSLVMGLKEMMQEEFLIDKKTRKRKINFVCFTNFPVADQANQNIPFDYLALALSDPLYSLRDRSVLESIICGIECFGKIPSSFDE